MKRNRLMTLAFGAMIAMGTTFGTVGQVQATEFYWVDINSAAPTAPYTNALNAARSVQQVLPYTQSGDIVAVMPGTYLLASSIEVTNNLTIYSAEGLLPDTVIFDGQDLHTCFDLGDTGSIISGFTIRNGKEAAIRCSGTQPQANDCIIENTDGTGMVQGRATDCIFRNNTGAYYGGGANSTIATGCTFINNKANHGGGLYRGTAIDCTIRQNQANIAGGGMTYGSATNCTIAGNVSAGNGGGLNFANAVGCAIFGNSSSGSGGGMSQGTATHCTITENVAASGGGMYSGRANNSILWNNTAMDEYTNTRSTPLYTCCVPPGTLNLRENSITNNPQLISTSHLAGTSPCLDAGNTNYVVGIDIDGESWNTQPAIGCDEVDVDNVTGLLSFNNDLPEKITAGQELYFNAYIDGPVTQTLLDFGDGTVLTNSPSLVHSHTWAYGNYHIILTGYNDTFPAGVSSTNTIYVRNDTTTTIYVSDTDGHDAFNGESWATAKKTIQAGVDAQDFTGGLVLVSNGTYSVTTEIIVNKDVRIQSQNGSTVTTIQGDNQHQCFNLNNQHCLVEGFTIRDGGGYSANGPPGGGAIYCAGLNPIVSNCIITENSSGGSGGGVMWRGTANSCTFTNNTGGNGPGGMQSGIANDCLFINNVSGNVGGGGMSGGTANRCVFKENKSTTGGGARDTVANDCQFLFNESTTLGGGMYSGTANNCVFRGNKSIQAGGGAYNTTATHCTFTANRAATSGGGMYNGTANNCILWYNTALISDDNIVPSTVNYSCAPELIHGTDGNITNMPLLVSASHISAASPCVNKGSAAFSNSSTDFDGETWKTSPAMGCDEPADPVTGIPVLTIDGPSDVYMGHEAFYTIDIQGAIERDRIYFGDGDIVTNTSIAPIHHTWSEPGTYNMTLRVWNNQDIYSISRLITVHSNDYNAIYVATNGNDAAYGTSWATAKQTIQAGIEAQDQTGGLVLVSNGVYTLTETIQIDKEIRLHSVNGAETTIIDGIDLYGLNYRRSRIMEIGDNHSTVDGFTLRNARYGWTGGALFCDYTQTPLVSNCIFSDNTAGTAGGMCYGTAIDCAFSNNTATSGKGGGLYIGDATRCQFIGNSSRDGGGGMYAGTATDCTFAENTGGYGSGMREGTANGCTFENNDSNYGGGTHSCAVTDSTFSGNTALQGGGMHGGTATDCTFIGNSSATHGGAIYNATSTRCILSGNRSTLGGGMYSGSAYTCAISGNQADDIGGGTHSTKLYNCTVTGNSARETGGVHGQTKNCIVWGNTATFGMNDINDGNIHLNYIVNTCSPDAPHGTDGCITNNPLLISGSHIAANSYCIGKGDTAYASGTDLDGEAWNTPPSMGCDEIGESLSGPIEMALFGPSPIAIYAAANYTALFNGPVSKTIVDFADGTRVTNAVGMLTHSWGGPNSADYDVVLTAFNDTYPQGISYTQVVQVVNNDDSDIHVWSTGNDLADGKTWATAKKTIQAGVDAQNIYGGLVLVDGNTYAIPETITINKPIHLKGYNANGTDGLIPIIDAGNSNRCFTLGFSACVLENLIIQNGENSSGYGGGIYCQNGAPRITYSTIRNCTAYGGAGTYKGTVENCTLENNIATDYGGAANLSTLKDSTLSGNNAKYGGGLYDGTLTGCTLSNNTATIRGGAAEYSTVIFSNISSNAAPTAGGLSYCDADRCHITTNSATVSNGGGMFYGTAQNCTFHWNRAEQYGGGSFATLLRNCTVVENLAVKDGGGIYGGTIYNSISWSNYIWEGTNPDITGTTPRNSCSPDLTHGQFGNITNAPLFVAHAPGFLIRGSDYYLSNFSPCLNAGDNSYVETDTDFNGWVRISYSIVDIGANEMYFFASDTDGDEMPDGWELENFGGTTNAVGSADADSDIFDNYSEYIAGTDPNDGMSYLRVTQSDIVANGTNTQITLDWEPSVEGRAYGVLWSTNLVDGFEDLNWTLPYPDDQVIFDHDHPKSFYKIKVWIEN